MFDLIKKLCSVCGVSGNEEEIRSVIESEIKDKVDEIITDTLGNLIAIKKGAGKKIMLAAHMDEVGVIVTHIDEKGFLRFSNIGGGSPYFILGQRVKFANGTVGAVYYEEKLQDMKNLKISNIYIDIGAIDKITAEKKVKVGDTACFIGETIKEGDMIISKGLDDRIGCSVLVEVIKELKATDNEIYFVFTVQEELGARGAKTAAFLLNPDIAISVDVTATGDTPECGVMEVKCGKGPTIKIKDRSIICHPEVKRMLEDTAKRENIPYQYEILEHGGTDAGAIHLVCGGIPSGGVSIPCRYVHSRMEMVNIGDVRNAVKLLKAVIN